MNNLFIENIKIALNSIKSHLLRTVLTILIIAFGIMALVGILTAIDSIKYSITSNFTRMGANTFSIKNRSMRIRFGEHSHKRYEAITYDEALRFKKEFQFPSYVSVTSFASHIATVKYKSIKTNPNIPVIGADEDYLIISGYELDKGRNFSQQEINFGTNGLSLKKQWPGFDNIKGQN